MNRLALTLSSLLLLTLAAHAQTTYQLGPGVCNTSGVSTFYCIGMSSTLGSLSFFTPTRNGGFTTGELFVIDGGTGQYVIDASCSNGNPCGTGTASSTLVTETVILPDGRTANLSVNMSSSIVCYSHRCHSVPSATGGTLTISQ